MFDYIDLLQSFAKQQNSPAPVPVDRTKSVIILNSPGNVEKDVFVNHMTECAQKLLQLFYEQDAKDTFIGISEIGYEPHKLPVLYMHSLLALKQRFYKTPAMYYFITAKAA